MYIRRFKVKVKRRALKLPFVLVFGDAFVHCCHVPCYILVEWFDQEASSRQGLTLS
jgi:hypothetical protein